MRNSFLCTILYIISLEYTTGNSCPSRYCSCDFQGPWSCNIKTDEDQINCYKQSFNTKLIVVNLNLLIINFEREKTIFTNINNCKIRILRISTNQMPRNRIISNLIFLQYLIIEGKSHDLLDNSGLEFDNLLSGLINLKRFKLELIKVTIWSTKILNYCQNVEEIELKSNNIESIEFDSFINCKLLTKLTIKYNNILKLFLSTFNGLLNLNYLILSSNKIEDIITNNNGWWVVQNLNKLDLSHNSLSKLDVKAFIGLNKLQHLILNNNQLLSIDKTSFQGLMNLKILNLKNNPKLIILDLIVLSPMMKTLSNLYIDYKFIHCIETKSILYKFPKKIQDIFISKRDCNIIDREINKINISISTHQSIAPQIVNSMTMVISISVLITILILGLIFFLSYYCTSKKKIKKYKANSLEGTNSGSYKICQQSLDMPHNHYTYERSNPFAATINNPHSRTTKYIARYTSNPVLPRTEMF